MKLADRGKKRSVTIGPIKRDTPLMGATVGEWDDAMTGNMDKTLAKVKALAEATGNKRNIADATTFDLASAVGKRLASDKE